MLGVDLIFTEDTDAFDALAALKKWNIDTRINLLEEAEMELARALTGKS